MCMTADCRRGAGRQEMKKTAGGVTWKAAKPS